MEMENGKWRIVNSEWKMGKGFDIQATQVVE